MGSPKRPPVDTGGVQAALEVVSRFRPSRRRFIAWANQEPALTGLSWDALQQTLLDRGTSPDRKDDLLAALLRLSRSDPDATAALIVCLSPGLRNMARHLVQNGGIEYEDAWAEVHLGLCDRIARYNLSARPRRIAANLIRDAVQPLRRAVRAQARHDAHHTPLTSQHRPTTAAPRLTADVILSLARHAGIIAPIDAALIAATRLHDLSLRQAAALLGLSLEAAKKRRQRAEPHLADWWLTASPEPSAPAPRPALSVIRPAAA